MGALYSYVFIPKKKEVESHSSYKSKQRSYSMVSLYFIFLLGFSNFLIVQGFTSSVIQLYIKNIFQVHSAHASMIIGIYNGASLISLLLFGGISDKIGREKPILIGFLIQILGYTTLIFYSNLILLYIISLMVGFATAVSGPAILALLADVTYQDPAAVSYYNAFRDLGFVLGPILAGLLFDIFNIITVLLNYTTLLIVSLMIFGIEKSRKRHLVCSNLRFSIKKRIYS